MELFDSHCHLADPKLYHNHKKIIKVAIETGVERIITVGYDDNTNYLSVKIAQENAGVWAAIGIHPNETYSKEIVLSVGNKVVAIGETGLDYYRDNIDRRIQKDRLRRHIDIARSHQLPIIIHTRKAFDDAISIVAEEKYRSGVFHCFSGNINDARRIIDLGFYISFSGSLTYGSSKLVKVLRFIPKERILFETDSPYMSPIRGKINEPSNVKLIVKYGAEILNMPVEDLAILSSENGRRLFGV